MTDRAVLCMLQLILVPRSFVCGVWYARLRPFNRTPPPFIRTRCERECERTPIRKLGRRRDRLRFGCTVIDCAPRDRRTTCASEIQPTLLQIGITPGSPGRADAQGDGRRCAARPAAPNGGGVGEQRTRRHALCPKHLPRSRIPTQRISPTVEEHGKRGRRLDVCALAVVSRRACAGRQQVASYHIWQGMAWDCMLCTERTDRGHPSVITAPIDAVKKDELYCIRYDDRDSKRAGQRYQFAAWGADRESSSRARRRATRQASRAWRTTA
jgi:hypothetical protein